VCFSAQELEEERKKKQASGEVMAPVVLGFSQAVIISVRESVTHCCCWFSLTSSSGPGQAHVVPQAQRGRAAVGRLFRATACRRHVVPAAEHITASPGVDKSCL